MHDDKKGFNYDAMRHHHGHEDPYDYPSHGHRHPAYDFPDIYHPVPYGKEFLGNQPIRLQDPYSGHIVHPCPPRDWGRHGCEGHHHHEHWHEAPHVPPMHDYLSEYVGLLEDYFHKDKGLDDCDCGEAIRHLRGEIRQLLKALEKELRQLDNSYDSLKSKLAYYIGKTQACIQTTEEYMRRQEYIDADWAAMKAKYGELIEAWGEFVTINVLTYKADTEYNTISESPEVADVVEAYASGLPVISGVDTEQDFDNDDRYIINVRGDFTHLKHEYNHPENGTYIELKSFLELKSSDGTSVSGNYLLLEDRIEVVDVCEDKKVIDHPEIWERSDGYPRLTKLLDYSQGTTPLAVKTGMIDNKAVTEAKLADNAVTSSKIKDGEVKTNDIADGNVTTAKLADGAVTSTKIANKAVTTGKLDDGAVETDKIADNAITSAKIKDGEVKTADIADGNVTTPKLADSAVTNAKINNNAVSEDKLSTAVQNKLNRTDNNTTYTLTKSGSTITLTGSDGSTTSVTDSDENTTVIEDGSITNAKLASGAVTEGKIGSNAVTNGKLATGAVTENKIGNGEVTEAKLSNAVQAKLNRTDSNTTYSLSKSGSTITLTGSDGSTTSVTDSSGSATDNNTTYSLSKSGSTITLTGSDGSTTSVTDANDNTTYSAATANSDGLMTSTMVRKLNSVDLGLVADANLNTLGVFEGYLRLYKAMGIVTICTEEANIVHTAFNSKAYVKICTLPSGYEPTRRVDTVGIVADKLTNVRIDTDGSVYVYVFYNDAAQVPTGWHLHFSIAYQEG